MKTASPQKWTMAVVATLAGALLMTGCETTKAAKHDESMHGHSHAMKAGTCPACGHKLDKVAVSDLSYAECVCPECKATTIIDPTLTTTLRSYMGEMTADTVHVCHDCQKVVETCAICRDKM